MRFVLNLFLAVVLLVGHPVAAQDTSTYRLVGVPIDDAQNFSTASNPQALDTSAAQTGKAVDTNVPSKERAVEAKEGEFPWAGALVLALLGWIVFVVLRGIIRWLSRSKPVLEKLSPQPPEATAPVKASSTFFQYLGFAIILLLGVAFWQVLPVPPGRLDADDSTDSALNGASSRVEAQCQRQLFGSARDKMSDMGIPWTSEDVVCHVKELNMSELSDYNSWRGDGECRGSKSGTMYLVYNKGALPRCYVKQCLDGRAGDAFDRDFSCVPH